MLRPATRTVDDAIARSVAHAREAPFYKRAFAGVVVRGARDLRSLPLLDKPRAAEVQERLVVARVPAAPPAYGAGVVSSATTRRGRPLRVQLAAADVEGASVVDTPAERATLEIVSPRHGLRAPGGPRTLVLAALHPNTVDVTHDLLASGRFHTVVSPLATLKWITASLLGAGVKLPAFKLQVLGTTGYPVTRHTRALLEGAWRAIVVDNWSMSELRGHAHPCRCGFSHWRGAPTWFELLDPLSTRPVPQKTGALGELVATTLLPHGARMPLVRYRSGDVVEVGPMCPRDGTRGIRFRGRASTSLLGTRGTRTVARALARDLLEVTEGLVHDVAFEPHPAERLGLVTSAVPLGVPKARVKDGRVEVEVTFEPASASARAKAVTRALRAAVKGDVEIVLVGPGRLDFTREARKL